MQNLTKRLIMWAVIVVALLMIPFLAHWPWSAGDYVFGIVMLYGSALVYELVARKLRTGAYRLAVGVAVAAAFLLVWINAAVGIIGDGPINMLYLGVIAVGIVGAVASRLKPQGLMRTLVAMAIAQMLVPVVALIVGTPDFSPGVARVLGFNGFFALAFIISAILFRQADSTKLEAKLAV